MFQHGILVLTYGPKNIPSFLSKVGGYLSIASKKVSKTLYVSLKPNQHSPACHNQSSSGTSGGTFDKDAKTLLYNRKDLIRMVPAIYVEAHRQAPLLDVRVLHHYEFRPPKHPDQTSHQMQNMINKRKLAFSPQVIITDNQLNQEHLIEHLINFDIPAQLEIIAMEKEYCPEHHPNFGSRITDNFYDYVCLGGTFDNLHNGHKILLSTGQLKSNKALTIGVTNGEMLKNKTLQDLIEPAKKRCETLNNYLQDVDPFIEYRTCIIHDPFGPAITDQSLQAIIVSEETIKGGQKINEIRRSKGWPELCIEVIEILEDANKTNEIEEAKVSSSSLRIRKLGTLLKEPEEKPHLPKRPYLIGLTGIIASGKTSISKKLQSLGAGIINVDLLAHQTYQDSNAPAYQKLIDTFGPQILDQNGQIARPVLGKIVFNDLDKLKQLNEIVWPEVFKLMKQRIDEMKDQHNVIVLEIAILVESNFDKHVHQVWMTILDEKEVIERLKRRNNLSEEEALKRIRALIPQKDKIKYANVVFCTQWDESFTMEQVKKAWKMLHERFLTE